MDKSYVSIEQKVCPVCGKRHDSGALLVDKRLRDRFHKTTTTGWDMCKEDKERFDQGYIALIEAETPPGTTSLTLETANRLGRVIHMKHEAFQRLLGDEKAGLDVAGNKLPLVFVASEICDWLEKLANGQNTEATNHTEN